MIIVFQKLTKGTYGKIFLSSVDTIDNEDMLSDNNSFCMAKRRRRRKKKKTMMLIMNELRLNRYAEIVIHIERVQERKRA